VEAVIYEEEADAVVPGFKRRKRRMWCGREGVD
jgi:hypothetical protein